MSVCEFCFGISVLDTACFLESVFYMSSVMRNPVLPGLTQTWLYSHRRLLEAKNFGFRKKRDCTIYVAKTKQRG